MPMLATAAPTPAPSTTPTNTLNGKAATPQREIVVPWLRFFPLTVIIPDTGLTRQYQSIRLTLRRRGDRITGGMSAFDTKRTSRVALHMSAFGGKADSTSPSLMCEKATPRQLSLSSMPRCVATITRRLRALLSRNDAADKFPRHH